MDRRRIGQQQRRALVEAALGRQTECRLRRDDDLFGQPAKARDGDQPVADAPALDALADRLDLARDLAARRERPRRLHLIFVLDDQHVGIIDRRRADADQQLAWPGDRIRQLRPAEASPARRARG